MVYNGLLSIPQPPHSHPHPPYKSLLNTVIATLNFNITVKCLTVIERLDFCGKLCNFINEFI